MWRVVCNMCYIAFLVAAVVRFIVSDLQKQVRLFQIVFAAIAPKTWSRSASVVRKLNFCCEKNAAGRSILQSVKLPVLVPAVLVPRYNFLYRYWYRKKENFESIVLYCTGALQKALYRRISGTFSIRYFTFLMSKAHFHGLGWARSPWIGFSANFWPFWLI